MSKTYVLNWIDALAKTYDQNKDNIGKTKDGNEKMEALREFAYDSKNIGKRKYNRIH